MLRFKTFVRKNLSKGINDIFLSFLAASFMAALVAYVNWDYSRDLIIAAAAKQGIYTFIAGVLLLRVYKFLHRRYPDAVLIAILVPSILTTLLTYLLHLFGSGFGIETPEPLKSALITAILSPPTYLVVHWLNKSKEYKDYVDLEIGEPYEG